MIEANEHIFGKLTDFVQKHDTGFIVGENKHCIETDADEKRWLQELRVLNQQQILPSFRTASFKFDNDIYFVVVGWNRHIEDEDCIQIIELNAGIVTALLFELRVPIRPQTSPLEIIDKIFYESEERVVKHNFELVANFFDPITIYKVQSDSPFKVQSDSPSTEEDEEENKVDIVRLSGYYTIRNRQAISLNFSEQTLKNFEKLFTEGSGNIPSENILFSLVSVYWKYSFLDIYRCIERLFCLAALEQFHQSLSISSSLLRFSIDLENHIGWKPKEIEALKILVQNCPEAALEDLREIKSQIDGSTGNECGDIVYRIRNSIVHFRPATEQFQLTDIHWDKLINSSLLVVQHLYQQYDEKLTLD